MYMGQGSFSPYPASRGSEDIFLSFSRWLYRFIAFLIDSHEDTEEIIQDIFLKVWIKKETHCPSIQKPAESVTTTRAIHTRSDRLHL